MDTAKCVLKHHEDLAPHALTRGALAEYVEDYSDFYSNRSDGWEMHGDGFVQGPCCSLCRALPKP